MNRSSNILAATALLTISNARPASAADPSPAAYAIFLHLTIGNLLLGIAEGMLLAALFKRRALVCIGIMIFANAAISFIGGADVLWFGQVVAPRIWGDAPLYRVRGTLAASWGIAYAVALLIALPFCWWLLSGAVDTKARLKGALLAALISQTVGCAVIIPFHLGAGTLSLFTAVKTDPELSFLNESARAHWVYFIHTETGEAHRIRSDGTCLERVSTAGPLRSLELIHSTRTAMWYVRGRLLGPREPEPIVLAQYVSTSPRAREVSLAERIDGRAAGVMVHDLRTARNGSSVFLPGLPHEGLVVHVGTETYRVGFEVFPLSWEVASPTIVDGDIVIFQFGGQIVALDARNRRIGMVFPRGRSPIVVPASLTAPSHGARASAVPPSTPHTDR